MKTTQLFRDFIIQHPTWWISIFENDHYYFTCYTIHRGLWNATAEYQRTVQIFHYSSTDIAFCSVVRVGILTIRSERPKMLDYFLFMFKGHLLVSGLCSISNRSKCDLWQGITVDERCTNLTELKICMIMDSFHDYVYFLVNSNTDMCRKRSMNAQTKQQRPTLDNILSYRNETKSRRIRFVVEKKKW